MFVILLFDLCLLVLIIVSSIDDLPPLALLAGADDAVVGDDVRVLRSAQVRAYDDRA